MIYIMGAAFDDTVMVQAQPEANSCNAQTTVWALGQLAKPPSAHARDRFCSIHIHMRPASTNACCTDDLCVSCESGTWIKPPGLACPGLLRWRRQSASAMTPFQHAMARTFDPAR